MAERVVVQLGHANSAVVLTSIKVLLYRMNYMDNRKLMDYICKKMGPPLGRVYCLARVASLMVYVASDYTIFGSGSAVRCSTEYPAHHTATAVGAEERRESLLL